VGEILAISISPYGDHRLLIKAKNILRYHTYGVGLCGNSTPAQGNRIRGPSPHNRILPQGNAPGSPGLNLGIRAQGYGIGGIDGGIGTYRSRAVCGYG
jgi:hypothetical protein